MDIAKTIITVEQIYNYTMFIPLVLDLTTTYHHCRTDLQLYNVFNQRYMNSNCRTDLQLYNVFARCIYGQYYNLSSL